jgi:hypothetical protein
MWCLDLPSVHPDHVDVEAALAWRDFMVSEYSDAGQERWLASAGIDLLGGSGRLAGVGPAPTRSVPRPASGCGRPRPRQPTGSTSSISAAV